VHPKLKSPSVSNRRTDYLKPSWKNIPRTNVYVAKNSLKLYVSTGLILQVRKLRPTEREEQKQIDPNNLSLMLDVPPANIPRPSFQEARNCFQFNWPCPAVVHCQDAPLIKYF
jgi:hypothetical protein